MKKLRIKEVQVLLNEDVNYFIQVNEFTRQIRLVRYNAGCFDEIIGYLTFNQFIKLDLVFGLAELPINSFMYNYFTLQKVNA